MSKRQVFYSFHFDNDVMRVQQIRNMGIIEDDTPVSPNEWEQIKRNGDEAIRKWIDDNMRYRSCVVVLIGEETANRKWVKYEIEKAWNDGKGLFGIYIHNINCVRNGKCKQGANPFDRLTFNDGSKFSSIIKCYNPNASDTYNDISNNLETWVNDAIAERKK
jgi:hypothetical protein